MAKNNHGEGLGDTVFDECSKVIEDFLVGLIAELATGRSQREPLESSYLIVGDKLGLLNRLGGHFGRPVLYKLVLAIGHDVFGCAERNTKGNLDAGFFTNLAHSGLGESFAGVNLALGQGNVFVFGAVNDKNVNIITDDAPEHSTCCIHSCGVGGAHRCPPGRRRLLMLFIR